MENKDIYSTKGYPIYTKRICDFATIYIKKGEIIKNREDRKFILQDEINNFNNIVIEEGNIVNIYCSTEKISLYAKEIEFLKTIYKGIEDRIIINSQQN